MDDIEERVQKLEIDIGKLATEQTHMTDRFNKFEQACVRNHERIADTFEKLNERFTKFTNEEVHRLETLIDDATKSKRQPLSWKDWIKIFGICMTFVGTVVVAIIANWI